MRTYSKAAPMVVAALLASAAWATAADFCFHSGSDTVALKAFSPPARGRCKDYRGFYTGGGSIWVHGTACGSSDSARVTFFHEVNGDGGSMAFTEQFVLDRQTMSGSGIICLLDTGFGGSCGPRTYAATTCSDPIVPVP